MFNYIDCCEDYCNEVMQHKCESCPKLEAWRTSKDPAMIHPAKVQTFEEYIKEARNEFVEKFYFFFPNRQAAKLEAVWSENILIAYDQLTAKLAEANEKLSKISELLNTK